MAESSTKRRRVEEHNEDEEEEEEEEDDIDRISTLPDPLLLYILSFLPTRTSVATMSLVSRKWRNLWEQLQVFNLDDSDPIFDTPHRCDYKKFKKFAYYVDSVLSADPATFESSVSAVDTRMRTSLKCGSALPLDPTFNNSISRFQTLIV
jgi:hypothetical protein